MTATTLRPAQLRRAAQVADALRDLDDAGLHEVAAKLAEVVLQNIEGRGWDHPVTQAFAKLHSVTADESNYRLGVLWNAESEIRGGHRVQVTNDWSALGTFEAVCFPEWDDNGDGRTCWEGPPRATFDEAMEDGRRHNSGWEPDDRRTGYDGLDWMT